MTDTTATRSVGRSNERWSDLLSVAMLTNPGAAVGVITPAVTGMFTAAGRFPLATAALLGAVELAGLTVALLLGPWFVDRFDRRRTATAAIGVAILGQSLSLATDIPAAVAVLRFAAGLGEGGLYAVAIAYLASTAAPDRAFGVVVTSNHIVGVTLLTVIAWVSADYPAQAAVVVVVVFQLLTALLIVRLPRRPEPPSAPAIATDIVDQAPPSISAPAATAILGLLGTFLLSAGFGAVWPMIGQIAAEREIAPGIVALAFSLAGVAGLVPGLIVTALGLRLGRALPLAAASIGFALSLLLPTTDVTFFAPTVLILFFWTFNIPYYLGFVAAIDRSGRLAVFTSAMIPFGIAVGQGVSGQIAASAGFQAVTALGATSVGLALAVMLVAIYRDRDRVVGYG